MHNFLQHMLWLQTAAAVESLIVSTALPPPANPRTAAGYYMIRSRHTLRHPPPTRSISRLQEGMAPSWKNHYCRRPAVAVQPRRCGASQPAAPWLNPFPGKKMLRCQQRTTHIMYHTKVEKATPYHTGLLGADFQGLKKLISVSAQRREGKLEIGNWKLVGVVCVGPISSR